MGDVSGHVKCDWSAVMRANGYVIHVTPTIWSIVVETHALRKSWAVTMTVLGVVTINVRQSVVNLWKKRSHSVDTSKQCDLEGLEQSAMQRTVR